MRSAIHPPVVVIILTGGHDIAPAKGQSLLATAFRRHHRSRRRIVAARDRCQRQVADGSRRIRAIFKQSPGSTDQGLPIALKGERIGHHQAVSELDGVATLEVVVGRAAHHCITHQPGPGAGKGQGGVETPRREVVVPGAFDEELRRGFDTAAVVDENPVAVMASRRAPGKLWQSGIELIFEAHDRNYEPVRFPMLSMISVVEL